MTSIKQETTLRIRKLRLKLTVWSPKTYKHDDKKEKMDGKQIQHKPGGLSNENMYGIKPRRMARQAKVKSAMHK